MNFIRYLTHYVLLWTIFFVCINLFIYWYIYEIILFIIQPIIHTYNTLLYFDYNQTPSFIINRHPQYIKLYYSLGIEPWINTRQNIVYYTIYPDIISLENNTMTLYTQLLCTLLLSVPLVLFITNKYLYLIIYLITLAYTHFIVITYKTNQIINDFVETEYLFNFQFTVDFYIQMYLKTLAVSILFSFFLPTLINMKLKRYQFYLLAIICASLILGISSYNTINMILNINIIDIIHITLFYILLYEILYLINLIKLEMTGIEPA